MKHIGNLTRAETRAINVLLRPRGRQMCVTCGTNHPLDTDHYYFRHCYRNGHDYARWSTECKSCEQLDAAERMRRRYRSDEAYRLAVVKRAAMWHRSDPARKRRFDAVYRLKRKREQFRRVMYE